MTKQREVPKKNYVYFMLLTFITLVALIYFVKWYQIRESEQVKSTVQISVASELKADEIDNYLLENPDVIVYIASSKDGVMSSFEKRFDDYLRNKELLNKIVYIDTAKITEEERIQIEQKWFDGNNIIEPNFLVISDSQKAGVLYTKNPTLQLKEIHEFLTKYEVIE